MTQNYRLNHGLIRLRRWNGLPGGNIELKNGVLSNPVSNPQNHNNFGLIRGIFRVPGKSE